MLHLSTTKPLILVDGEYPIGGKTLFCCKGHNAQGQPVEAYIQDTTAASALEQAVALNLTIGSVDPLYQEEAEEFWSERPTMNCLDAWQYWIECDAQVSELRKAA